MLWPYSEKNVNRLHKRQNHIPNLSLMVAVTREHESTGDEVVCEHLPMVFPPLLYVDDKDLLQPERKLHEIVPFHGSFYFSVWPAGPHLLHVEPVLVCVHYVLHIVINF